MLCITAHYNEYVRSITLFSHCYPNAILLQKHIKELVRQTAMHVLNAGGVVRGINSWGTCRLPQRMQRHQQYYDKGECVVFIFPFLLLLPTKLASLQLLDDAL